VVFFFAIFIPQQAILSVMNTDPLTALYLILEHGVLDACFVIAAFLFTSAVLQQRATLVDLALTTRPPLLVALSSLALVIFGLFILLIVQGRWEMFIQAVFHLAAPANDWGLPGLRAHLPISFGVEVFVLCGLAPFAEEVLFRGFLFQWLERRFNLWIGVVVSSLVFSSVHASIFGLANTLLLGVFSALLLRYSRSLWFGLFVLFALGMVK